MSSAAVSLATTQPPASRPSTSGRNPCGSRAAYRVFSSMKTSENAPRARRSVAKAASSTPPGPAPPGGLANSAVSTSVSEVPAWTARNWPGGPPAPSSRARASRAVSSSALIRLPLWPRATPPVAVARNVGWALSHTEEPAVE